jgi:hypothetical protein
VQNLNPSQLMLIPAALLALSGCGLGGPQLALPARAVPAGAVAVQGVAPDNANVIAKDTQKAQYWQNDAQLVMSIQTTALNTTAISASANVYFSRNAQAQSQAPVFVARHYGIASFAHYVAVMDAADLAANMRPLPGQGVTVKAEDAFAIAKHLAMPPIALPGCACPAPVPTANRFFFSSRALLIQPQQGNPMWAFYAGSQTFTIDAVTQQAYGPVTRVNANNPTAIGPDVALQRAASVWLPTSLFAPVLNPPPAPTSQPVVTPTPPPAPSGQ